MPKKILYIQHTPTLSGSAKSLLFMIEGLDKSRYQPVIGMARPTDELRRLYAPTGVECVDAPGIPLYEHTTGRWYGYRNPLHLYHRIRQARALHAGESSTLELVRQVKPDLVHLNSIVLLPSALALARANIPFVWHVRESPVHGLFGKRVKWIRRCLLSLPTSLIFISEHDRQAWTGSETAGEVIPNFIDFSLFDKSLSSITSRQKLKLPLETPIILYVGGLNRIKGIFPLLRALARLRKEFPNLRCVLPMGQSPPVTGRLLKLARWALPLVGSGTDVQKIEAEIQSLGIADLLLRLPPDPDIVPYFAAADLVVFPSVEPHFARPVIEASAMAKPVVGSRIGGVEELIEEEVTGLLAEPGDDLQLAGALESLLRHPDLRRQMGEAGYEMAKKRFNVKMNVQRIQQIYDEILLRTTATGD